MNHRTPLLSIGLLGLLGCGAPSGPARGPEAPRPEARVEVGVKSAFEEPVLWGEAWIARYGETSDPGALTEAERVLRRSLPQRGRHDYPRFLLAHALREAGRGADAEQVLAGSDPARRHVFEKYFATSSASLAPYLRGNLARACDTRKELPKELCEGAGGARELPGDYPVFEQISAISHSTDRFSTWNVAREGEEIADLARRAGIREGMDVADIGAGEGWFTLPLARVVAPGGSVTANEIDRVYLDFIEYGAAFHALTNVRTILGTPEDPSLPAASFDVVFVCEVFKAIVTNGSARDRTYVEGRVLPFLRSLRAALRPGGRLIVVDHDSPENVDRAISPAVIRKLAEEVGFRHEATLDDYKPLQVVMILGRGD
jgi:predicted methyltransferase